MYRCFDNNNVNLDSWETSDQILLGNEEPAAKEDTTTVGSQFAVGGWAEVPLYFCSQPTLGCLSNSPGSQFHFREAKGRTDFITILILWRIWKGESIKHTHLPVSSRWPEHPY